MGRFDHLSGEACRRLLERTYAEQLKRCRLLRNHVLARGWASEKEVQSVWPIEVPPDVARLAEDELRELAEKLEIRPEEEEGEPDLEALRTRVLNSGPSLDEWNQTYGNLRRFHARGERLEPDHERLEEVLLAAQNAEPSVVRVLAGEARLEVHPKSTASLLWFQVHDFLIGWFRDRADLLRDQILRSELDPERAPDPTDLLERVGREEAWRLALLCYAACEPGPRIERARAIERQRDEVPGLFSDLDPIDMRRIQLAFRWVNLGRLTNLNALRVPLSHDGRRVSWSIFHGSIATKLGKTAIESIRDVDLGSQLAQLKLANLPMEEELAKMERRRRASRNRRT